MPTELEELVEFLHHGNTQIRQIAAENLVPYSVSQPAIFKSTQHTPINDLKLLVRDYTPIAKNAITILINISGDGEVLKTLAEDDKFLETVLSRLFNKKEPNADALAMLLANMAKSSSMERLIDLERAPVDSFPTSTKRAISQLIELYNVGSGWNSDAKFDYLGYLFGDLAKFPGFTSYLTKPPTNSASSSPTLDPLTFFLPFASHESPIRRLGSALLLRNMALSFPDLVYLLQPAHSVLTPLLIPLCSPNQEDISAEEMDTLPEECQYLPPTHKQESDVEILKLEVETLYLLAARGGLEARKIMKENGTYIVIRELHLNKEEEAMRGWCEKIVDLLMGEEAHAEFQKQQSQGHAAADGNNIIGTVDDRKLLADKIDDEEDDEDNQIIPIA